MSKTYICTSAAGKEGFAISWALNALASDKTIAEMLIEFLYSLLLVVTCVIDVKLEALCSKNNWISLVGFQKFKS